MKKTIATSALLVPSIAFASVEGSVTATSDYRLYGTSQTLEDPALQLELVYVAPKGFSAGIFLSNVDFVEDSDPNDLDANYESTYFLTYETSLNDDHGLAFTFIRYTYPGTNVDLDYNEIIIDYSSPIGAFTLGYSNDVLASDETGTRYEYSNGLALAENLNLSLLVGYYDLDDVFDDSYTYYDLAVTYTVDAFDFTLAYNGTSSEGETIFGDVAEDAVVGSITYSFSM